VSDDGRPPSPWRVALLEGAGAWGPGPVLAAGVLVLGVAGLVLTVPLGLVETAAVLLVVAVVATAVALHRRSPGLALALVWLATLLQLLGGLGIQPAQVGVLVVAYGCGRYGRAATLWVSGASLPLGGLLAAALVWSSRFTGIGQQLLLPIRQQYAASYPVVALLVAGVLLTTAVLAAPWALGLVLRLQDRSRAEEQQRVRAEQQRSVAVEEREQAEEIARLREDQTRLARDVHDVVGHSLAVILAQAESAQFRPETDSAAIRTTLANIAVSARQSLRDVRDVLSSTDGAAAVAGTRTGDLDALVEGVRAAGNEVRSEVVGAPRPLPPELEVVAFRVLQEMLTNALKHGRRGDAVLVERHWEGELRLEVRNAVAERSDSDETQPLHAVGAVGPVGPAGRGLEGMRRRLESVGGRLDVRRREAPDHGATFTATAWIPLRDGA
jgi:signal transduction histidine kinase